MPKKNWRSVSYIANTSFKTRTWVNITAGRAFIAFVQFHCFDLSSLAGVIIFGLNCFVLMFLCIKSGISEYLEGKSV